MAVSAAQEAQKIIQRRQESIRLHREQELDGQAGEFQDLSLLAPLKAAAQADAEQACPLNLFSFIAKYEAVEVRAARRWRRQAAQHHDARGGGDEPDSEGDGEGDEAARGRAASLAAPERVRDRRSRDLTGLRNFYGDEERHSAAPDLYNVDGLSLIHI